jgi:hypothetical protein
MPNKRSSTGMFALLTGVAAGAAAVFFSKKENRQMAKKELVKAEKTAMKVSAEIKKDPKKFAKKVERQGKVLAKKAVREASRDIKKMEKKVKSSPALKKVGKKSSKKR